MIKIPTSGYGYPLGPKIEKPPIPVGCVELEKAVDLLGREMFPDDWTGEERGFFGTGVFGQKFRSKVELETDRAFCEAILMAQCELECEIYGGDPAQRFHLRTTSQDDDDPFMPMGDLPRLPPQAMKEIERRFKREINQAKAVRERRENTEDRFLRELLWSGSLKAQYVNWDGRVVEIDAHIWGSAEGKRYFERGWVELSKHDGETNVRSILVHESSFLAILRPDPIAPDTDGVHLSPDMASTNTGVSRKGSRKLLPSNINDDDALDKMESLLKTDPSVRSVNAASYMVVEEAAGGGTIDSRAKRLARKYATSNRHDPRKPE
jgi:hypothetical protein